MSIVVLPFLNLSGDPQQDRVSDGITDSLTTDLSRAIPGSFVVSRDTAFAYKGKAADARQIGRELDVRYVVEGSVLPDGELVRVNSQLIDAETGGHLWAERFDLKRSDVLEVQDDIVGRLSRAIGLKMIESEARRSERERAKSPEAHDLVLRAKALDQPADVEGDDGAGASAVRAGSRDRRRTIRRPSPASRRRTFSRSSTAIMTPATRTDWTSRMCS